MAKIAVVPAPVFSQVAATTRLTDVLARQGHEVTVWGPAQCREEVEACGARVELFEPEMSGVCGPGYVVELTRTAVRVADGLIERLFSSEIDLVVHDSQTPWARIAGEYLGIPRIVAHPMFPVALPYGAPSRADPHPPAPDVVEANAQFEAHWLAIADRWGVEIESSSDVIHSPAKTKLAFTTEKLIGNHTLGEGWHCVGPLLTPPPPTVQPADRPLVYVDCGAACTTRPEPSKAVIAGLADQPVDVLVSTGNRMLAAADLGALPSNVTLRPFVSAREALSRTSVHVTQAASDSVHESLLAGVSMVCIPQAVDQFSLARSVELLGAGIIVEEEPIDIRLAVNFLLQSEKAKRHTRQLAEHLATYDGEARVAEIIARVLRD